jgi:hypothetical protein
VRLLRPDTAFSISLKHVPGKRGINFSVAYDDFLASPPNADLKAQPLQEHGKFVAERILNLPITSRASSYVQLYVAFFLSGSCHLVADWAITRSQVTRNSTLVFFLLQAIIITLEDAVIFIGQTLGVPQPPPFLCYLWVIIWMTWSSPIWMEDMLRAGIRFHYSDFLETVAHLGVHVLQIHVGGSLE